MVMPHKFLAFCISIVLTYTTSGGYNVAVALGMAQSEWIYYSLCKAKKLQSGTLNGKPD